MAPTDEGMAVGNGEGAGGHAAGGAAGDDGAGCGPARGSGELAASAPLGGVLASLLRAARDASAEQLPALVDEHARRLGLREAQIWMIDHGHRHLVRIPSLGAGDPLPADRESVPLEGTAAGDAFRRLLPVGTDDRLWLPLTAGAERLGVLGLRRGGGVVPADLDAYAMLVGELVATKSDTSDSYFRLRRRERMSLEAELQWSLLPPLCARSASISLAGLLEPAYDVGGDAFDHALNDEVLHLAVLDAMGHDVGASILTHVAIGAYRHARRLGHDLPTTATQVDAALARYVGDSLFATAVLAQLDCRSGQLQWLGIGHPTPLMLRGGRVSELSGRSSHPLGLGIGDVRPERLQLEPGDRLLFYTDGVVDDRIWDVQEDALAWLGRRLAETAEPGTRLEEVVRELMLATVDRWGDRQGDDATLVLLEWTPP